MLGLSPRHLVWEWEEGGVMTPGTPQTSWDERVLERCVKALENLPPSYRVVARDLELRLDYKPNLRANTETGWQKMLLDSSSLIGRAADFFHACKRAGLAPQIEHWQTQDQSGYRITISR